MSDTTAAAQLRRILALVPELADDEAHSFEELAASLGTTRATLLEDIRSLTDRYDPGGFVEGGVTLWIEHDSVCLNGSHFRRPMRLTSAELRALELGLAMLEAERPAEEHAAIRRARRRLGEAIARLPDGEEEATLRVASLASGADAGHLRVLRSGVQARRKVRLRYRRGDRDVATDRVIAPYGLVVASGMWYAIARCEESEGIRVFRLDRVEGAVLLEEGFSVPSSWAVEQVVRERKVLHADAPQAMTVRYAPRIARWIAEREGREPDADGSLTIEHPLLDVAWGVRHVLQYGPDAEVLAPAVVREALARRLAAMVPGDAMAGA